MTEWEALLDAIQVCSVNQVGTAQAATALRAFGLTEVASASPAAQDFATSGDLEPLGH
jgi:hypothetical protein